MNTARLEPYFLLALIAAAFILTFFILKPFLGPLILAAVFAVVLYPLYQWVLKKIGERRKSLAALIVVVLCGVGILVPVATLGTRIIIEAEQLYSSLVGGGATAYVQSIFNFADSAIARYVPDAQDVSVTISDNIGAYGKSALTWLIGYLGGIFSGVAILLLKLFIFFVALYYLLRDGLMLKRHLIKLSPLNDTDDHAIVTSLAAAVNSVVKGNLTIALIQGVLTSIGFLIFGVPNAILWGSVTALAALIPGIGTTLVLAPAILYLFITGNTVQAVGLLIWGVFAVGLIDNFLGPKLIGHASGLHPLLVLVAVLGGVSLFGPLGIFIGPLAVTVLLSLLTVYTRSSEKSAAQ